MRIVKWLIAAVVVGLIVIVAVRWAGQKSSPPPAGEAVSSGLGASTVAVANGFVDASGKPVQSGTAADSTAVAQAAAFQSFQSDVAGFLQGRDAMSPKERQAAAKALVQALTEHMRAGQILPVQALAYGEMVLSKADLNTPERAELSSNLHKEVEDYSARMVGPSPTADPRFQIYQAKSKIVVDEVTRTLPPEQQQAAIAARLQQLREQIYSKPAQ
ncbi:phospholipase C accessory protein PlcR [Trinickia sp. YCB016]